MLVWDVVFLFIRGRFASFQITVSLCGAYIINTNSELYTKRYYYRNSEISIALNDQTR